MKIANKSNNVESVSPKTVKLVSAVFAIFLVFILGINVGRGNISFGLDSVFNKTVSKNAPKNLDFTSVQQAYDVLRKQFDGQLNEQDLLDGMKAGMASATGDPYTEFMNAKEAKSFDEQLNGSFSGIGAELARDDKSIVVVAPISGFPAEKAGLRSRDVIAEIDGKSAYDITVTEAVNKIRGPVNTKVKLKIIRDKKQELDFEITRQQITIPSVEHKIIDGNIGYLRISQFSEDTSGLTAKAASEFRSKNVAGVILDMRSNPGGLLNAAVDVSSQWLPKGQTVLQEKRDGVVIRTYTSSGEATLKGIPTVVLIDEGSASASEITAGALHDNKVATLIGQKSFGKGSVQTLERLPGGGVLKVTIARWFTPNGKNINKEGIMPDKKVERTAEDFKAGKDPQLDAAIGYFK